MNNQEEELKKRVETLENVLKTTSDTLKSFKHISEKTYQFNADTGKLKDMGKYGPRYSAKEIFEFIKEIFPEDSAEASSIDIEKHNGVFCLAINNQQELIGMFIIEGLTKDVCHFSTLGVKKEYRGKGLGTKLFLEAVEVSRRLNRRMIFNSENTPELRRFYEKNGARVWDETGTVLFFDI